MRKFLFSTIVGSTLFASSLFAEQAKGLNVVLTSADTQTQQMAMVLSMMTLKAGKEVNMVLCSKAGDLAIKGMKSEVLKPLDKSPKMLLKAIIGKGANVKVCPLYLPNSDKSSSDLMDGIGEAKPQNVAKKLLDKDFKVLSY